MGIAIYFSAWIGGFLLGAGIIGQRLSKKHQIARESWEKTLQAKDNFAQQQIDMIADDKDKIIESLKNQLEERPLVEPFSLAVGRLQHIVQDARHTLRLIDVKEIDDENSNT